MTIVTVLTGIFIGLAAGWAARRMVNDGGYGLAPDLLIGVAGSGVGSLALWLFGAVSDMSAVPLAVAAAIGAGTAIMAQRQVWAAPIVVRRVRRATPR